jgi:hypothetical protein
LRTDDGPYHQVLAFGVSPDFASDQTLYDTSLGPWLPSNPTNLCHGCRVPSVPTFATNDAGASWQFVDRPSITVFALDSTINLSPGFATDHTLLSTTSFGGASPSSFGCGARVSSDAGVSWQVPTAYSPMRRRRSVRHGHQQAWRYAHPGGVPGAVRPVVGSQ